MTMKLCLQGEISRELKERIRAKGRGKPEGQLGRSKFCAGNGGKLGQYAIKCCASAIAVDSGALIPN